MDLKHNVGKEVKEFTNKLEGGFTRLTKRASSPLMGSSSVNNNELSKQGDFLDVKSLKNAPIISGGTNAEGERPVSPSTSEIEKIIRSKRTKSEEIYLESLVKHNENVKKRRDSMSPWGANNIDIEVLSEVNLTTVLFTQGINAQQTLANAKIGGDTSVQTSINRTSLTKLTEYANSYRKSITSMQRNLPLSSLQNGAKNEGSVSRGEANSKKESGRKSYHNSNLLNLHSPQNLYWAEQSEKNELISGELNQIDSLMNEACKFLNEATEKGHEKNVNVLLKTGDICREMNGIHAIMCKSGKDR